MTKTINVKQITKGLRASIDTLTDDDVKLLSGLSEYQLKLIILEEENGDGSLMYVVDGEDDYVSVEQDYAGCTFTTDDTTIIVYTNGEEKRSLFSLNAVEAEYAPYRINRGDKEYRYVPLNYYIYRVVAAKLEGDSYRGYLKALKEDLTK